MLWCGTMDVFGEDTTDPIHKNNNDAGKKMRFDNMGED